MKQKSEGIGLVVGRVQRIEEEAANASLKELLLGEQTPSPTLSRSSSVSSVLMLDRSTHHSASQDVLEVKTMLLRLTRILQQQVSKEEGEETAPTSLQRDNNEILSLQRDSPEFVSLEEDTLSAGGGGGVGQERKEGRLEKENFRLKEQVEELLKGLEERDKRIQQLEDEVGSRRGSTCSIATQTRPNATHPVLSLRPHSMHDISSNNNNNNNSSLSLPRGARASSRPCHHTRGPCANDHSYHTSRSKVPPRSNSAGRRGGQNTPHRAESPWQYGTIVSTSTSPVQRKIQRVAQDRERAKSRATSMERLSSSSSTLSSRSPGHKLCIYVNSG